MSDSNNNSNNSNNESDRQDEPDNSGKHRKKKRKGREVTFIPYSEDNAVSTSETEDLYKRPPEEDNHLKFKAVVEESRKRFGSGWLLHNVSPSFLPTSDITENQQVSTSPGNQGVAVSAPEELESNLPEDQESPQRKTQAELIRSHSVTSPGIYTTSIFTPESTENSELESETEEGDESDLFFAHHYENDTPLMLSLGSSYFLESDGMSGKKLHRWLLTTVLSAELIQKENVCVLLKFSVLNPDKQERKYRMENIQTAKSFLTLLDPHLCQNSHENATVGALQCLKCQSEFSSSLVDNVLMPKMKETADGEVLQELKKVKKCPNCGSTVLVERFEKPTAPVSVPHTKDKTVSLESTKSAGNSNASPTIRPRSVSIENKMNELRFSRISGVQREENDSTSSSSIECILTTAEDDYEKSTLRSQSDITVLTNPSQSSFTIISQTCSSSSSHRDASQTEGDDFGNGNTSRPTSSPVNIAQKGVSQDSPWYDSSSTKTTVLQSPSPRAWNLSELNNSIVSCSSMTEEPDLSRRTQEDSQKIWDILEQKDDATQSAIRVNHQVKLHMEVNVFENEEEFVAGINGYVVLESSSHEVPGLLIVSTQNVYIFKGNSNDLSFDVTEYENLEKQSVKKLKNIYTLLGSQGFALSFALDASTQKTVLVILKDADICNSFVISLESDLQNVLNKTVSPTAPKFQLLTEEILLNVRKEIFEVSCEIGSENNQSVNLFLLGCVHRSSDSKRTTDSVAIVVTSECLYLANILYFTKPHDPVLHFQLVESQEIGNLTEVHLTDDMTSASFHFLDEDVGEEEYWLFEADSKASLASLLIMLKSPWEELFGIELELSISKDCSCGLQKQL